jgi:membrane-bound ClpP family serine protease
MLARRSRTVVLALAALLVHAGGSAAQNASPETGLYVTVPNPVTSTGYTQIKNRIDAARSKPESRPSVIVFDFNPGDKDATTAEFGVCYDLADLIAKLTDVPTVAYVHQKVSGHAVLPVLACKQIVCGPKGALGEVVGPGDAAPKPSQVNGYAEIVGAAHPAFLAVARKMADRDVQLRKGRRGATDWFADLRDRKKFEADGVTVTDTAPLPAAPDGRVGLFTAGQLRDLGLSQRTVETTRDVLETYGLPPSVLREDTTSGKAPLAYRFTLTGAIDAGMKESTARIVADAVRNKATLFFLTLEVTGGDPQAARELAEKLVELQQGENGIRIVAFVPDTAPDTAAVLALGCSEIVMSKRKDAAGGEAGEATLGDFETSTGKQMVASNLDFWRGSLRDLADRQGYPPLLIDAMLQPELSVLQVRKKTDQRAKRLMLESDYETDKAKGGEWLLVKSVKGKGVPFKLTASLAEELGVARFTTDRRDPAELYAKYGIDPAKVKDGTPAWLDLFANFLRIPAVTVLLIVIGFTGLMLELKVPGTTVPGIVAALCFILVFWAHTQFSGQVAVLGALLFILGLVLVLMEVFVLPGFGVAGVTGIILMLSALGLATVGLADGGLPSTGEDWVRLGTKMSQYLFGMIGGVVLAFTIARYLPHMPYANRLMLLPPGEQVHRTVEAMPGVAEAAGLFGAVGLTMTVLRPAGSVQFGDRYVDVVSDGSFVPAGARVQVVEVEGTRIVVREVSS